MKLRPERRYKPNDALSHEWLSSKTAAVLVNNVHPEVLHNLHSCNSLTELHYELLLIFTMFLNDKDIDMIRETFQSLDDDNSGTIEIDELRDCYIKINNELHEFAEIESIEQMTDE